MDPRERFQLQGPARYKESPVGPQLLLTNRLDIDYKNVPSGVSHAVRPRH